MKKDWKIVKIPSVVSFQEGPGVRKHQFTSEGVKLLNVGNINEGEINLNKTKVFISEKEAFGKYKHFLVDDGDLVIASSGIIVSNFHNKIAFIREEHLPLCMNTSTIRFKVIDNKIININYFKYFLKTPFFTNQLQRLITGSAQLNFGPSHLKKIDLILPPLEDQKRIIKILDNADTIRKKRKTIVDLLDNYMDSVFFEMFGSPESNIKKIAVRTVEDVASKEKHAIKAGPFGSSLKKEFYVKSGYKIYGQEQVIKNDFNYGDYYINEEKYKSLESCKIKSGDILISLVGSFGKISVVPEKFEPGIINPRLMKITSDQNIIYPEFLKEILSSKSVQQQIKNVSHGGTMGIVNIGIIKKIKIMVPKIDDQKLYLDKKEAVENLKQKMLLQSEEMEKLFQVLMQKAFKGEL
jgi:type I restriction enzyme S subunit